MVKIYCDTIDDEMREVARTLCRLQKEDVMLITLSGIIVEVHHEAETAETQEDID